MPLGAIQHPFQQDQLLGPRLTLGTPSTGSLSVLTSGFLTCCCLSLKHASGNFHMEGSSLFFECPLKCPLLSAAFLDHPMEVGTPTIIYLSTSCVPFPRLRRICHSLSFISFVCFFMRNVRPLSRNPAHLDYPAQCLPAM